MWSPAEFAESWREGAAMLLRSGTTTVGDIEALPELLPEGWRTTPLRVISFLEMTGIRSRRAPRQILQESVEKIDALPLGRCAAGLSPHAPYSTLPELMRLSARVARRRRWLLTTHVAESVAEFEMFAHGRGEMFDWLQRSERPMTDCCHSGASPCPGRTIRISSAVTTWPASKSRVKNNDRRKANPAISPEVRS